jgi:cytidyltransferase-like protein
MPGISHLYDIYNKKGSEFIDELFNSFLTVNEKMDGSAFVFERDQETGKFVFYKRDQRNPITLVDRTLMRYYEKPIQYLESLAPHILQKIPRGWRFGLEYFADVKPVEIAYDRIPKNNLILSYVHPRLESGKYGSIQEKEKLDSWADLIGVERPPIVFQGYLNNEQRDQILDFLRTPFEDLVTEYKTKSFVRFILGVLNPECKTSALNNDLDKPIEGIVFKFGTGKDQEQILSKMVDPVFTEMAKAKSKKRIEEKPSDFLGITILDVMNFILERGIDSFFVSGNSEDERYVSFISDVFSKFLDENGYKYKGTDFQEPEYLKKEDFRINRDLIRDRRVLHYVDMDDSYESLFKLILNSFRKIKKRSGGIITQGIIDQFNVLVKEIEEIVQKKKQISKMHESSTMPSFLEFKKSLGTKPIDYLMDENDSSKGDDDLFSYNDFISALETIDTADKPNSKKIDLVKEESEKKDLQKANLIIGRFQPFHNGHMKMVNFLEEKNDLPSILAVVHPGHNKSGKSPLDQDLISKSLESLVKDNPGKILGYFIINRGLLGLIYGKAKELGYLPQLIGAGEDRFDDYKKQSDWLKKAGGDFPEDVEVIETPRSGSSTKVREVLANEDYIGFKKLVPPSITSFYPQMISLLLDRSIKESEDGIDTKESLDEKNIIH